MTLRLAATVESVRAARHAVDGIDQLGSYDEASFNTRLLVTELVGNSVRHAGLDPADIIRSRSLVNSIYIDDRVKDYIVDVVFATREPSAYKLQLDGMIRYGASPRATIALTLVARARAFMSGRGYVTPQDIKSVGPDVLRHRIIVSYEAEAEEVTTEQIIERVFANLPVP